MSFSCVVVTNGEEADGLGSVHRPRGGSSCASSSPTHVCSHASDGTVLPFAVASVFSRSGERVTCRPVFGGPEGIEKKDERPTETGEDEREGVVGVSHGGVSLSVGITAGSADAFSFTASRGASREEAVECISMVM